MPKVAVLSNRNQLTSLSSISQSSSRPRCLLDSVLNATNASLLGPQGQDRLR